MSHDLIQSFMDEMRKRGLVPTEDVQADGELHRFAPDGYKKDDLHAWYILHLDHPVSGAFGSWKSMEKFTWSQNLGREMTTEEKDQLKKRMESDRKRKQRKEEEDRKKAKETAEYIWDHSPEVNDHPYLKRKKVKGDGARFSERGHYIGCLIIPVISNGELVGLQFIPPDTEREKRFLHGTPIPGSYCPVGPKPDKEFVICEGWATGKSIHESTGLSVICAFNAGNLEAVAKVWRQRLPDAKIIIASDDDRWTSKPMINPGIHFAQKAAAAIDAELRRPTFPPGFEKEKGKLTDFNDLAVNYGLEEVALQIKTGKASFEEAALIEASTPGIMALLEPFPHMSSARGGKPLGTIENLQELLDRMGVIVRYNVISKSEELIIPGSAYTIDNQENAAFAQVLSWCAYAKMPTDKLGNFMTTLADRNQFNPVATWIESKPWDGKTRLPDLYNTITAVDEDVDPSVRQLKEILMRKWLISAVAGAFSPNGVSAHGILVLQGAQYLGKTAWFKKLAPKHLDVIKDGMILRLDDKDSIKQVISNWMVELGELDATFKRSDISQMKAFITKDRDVLRQAYARKENSFVRRTVFFASVNPQEFLHDPTGNRRYWTIACQFINHDHGLDMQQIWAEILDLYKKGSSWFLDLEEMKLLNEANREFEFRDPLEDKILSFFDWDCKQTLWSWKTVSEILETMGNSRPSMVDVSKAGAIIKRLNGGKKKRTDKTRMTLIPPKRDLSQIPILYGDGFN